MKITKIEHQKNLDRVNIYLDNKFAFGLTDEIRYKYGLQSGMEIDSDFIDNVLKAEQQNKVTNNVLNLLSYRKRTVKEIYMALKKKGYESIYIETAIQYCKDKNYINDEDFALTFIRDRININKFGAGRIKSELIQKGISNEIIEEVLHVDLDNEFALAMELAEKRIRSYVGQDKNSIYRKLGGYLQRRGYSYDIISKVLKNLLE